MNILNLDDIDIDNMSLKDLDKFLEEHEKEIPVEKKKAKSSDKVGFKIIKSFGNLSEKKYPPVFSLIDWNGYVRYDVRSWKENMTVPMKGISFTEDDLKLIIQTYNEIDLSEFGKQQRANYSGGKAKAKIYENICRLSEAVISDKTWCKEINVINWGYGNKIDMRKWTDDYEKCSKGISITFEEFEKFIFYAKEEMGF